VTKNISQNQSWLRCKSRARQEIQVICIFDGIHAATLSDFQQCSSIDNIVTCLLSVVCKTCTAPSLSKFIQCRCSIC